VCGWYCTEQAVCKLAEVTTGFLQVLLGRCACCDWQRSLSHKLRFRAGCLPRHCGCCMRVKQRVITACLACVCTGWWHIHWFTLIMIMILNSEQPRHGCHLVGLGMHPPVKVQH
jgi:hypothetical protein